MARHGKARRGINLMQKLSAGVAVSGTVGPGTARRGTARNYDQTDQA